MAYDGSASSGLGGRSGTMSKPVSIALAVVCSMLMSTVTVSLTPDFASANWFERRALARAGLRACGGDIARLCPGVVPGGGRIAQCLTDNRDRLSPSCQRYVDLATTARTAYFACNDDAARLCAHVPPGGGRIISCLLQNEPLVSPACRNSIAEAEALLGR